MAQLTPQDAMPANIPTTCPVCEKALERGYLTVRGTKLGFFFFGFSYQHCWFKPQGREKEVVLGSQAKRHGVRCTGCGFVGMMGPEFS